MFYISCLKTVTCSSTCLSFVKTPLCFATFVRRSSSLGKMTETNQAPLDYINELVAKHRVVVFSKTWCPFCTKVKDLFGRENVEFHPVELDELNGYGEELQLKLHEKTKQKTVPNVFINGSHVGGCSDVVALQSKGELLKMIYVNKEYDYDAVVIGGGSGGIAAAKALARLGRTVALCDFVKPSPAGTTWGLGGTCVNVGCIPKKLMHRAALIHEDLYNAPAFGWKLPNKVEHDWSTMVTSVQSYIKSLNWNYRRDLKSAGVSYHNAYGRLVDPHTVKVQAANGSEKQMTAKNIIIAVGGRPNYPDVPGVKEYCITSDDLFSLKQSPGKSLIVGASYVALECASFLKGINLDVTVMVRSILLRGFDRSMSELVGENMARKGIVFVNECVLKCIEKVSDGSSDSLPVLKVTGVFKDGTEFCDTFNTVLVAIGRNPCTDDLNLEGVGVVTNKDGKIVTNPQEQTNIPSIYAIGDVAVGRPELTPTAILAGKLLAKRLHSESSEPVMDYENVASTVFTSVEYGCVGLTEDQAREQYKSDAVIYHDIYKPLENALIDHTYKCYVKLVCKKENDEEKVVGLHILGPNAGEITQGFALAVKLGVTKKDFDNLVGIHPTCAEVFTTLSVTTDSGQDLTDSKGC